MPSTKQSKTVNNPPKSSNTPLQSPAKDSIASKQSLIKNKLASLEDYIEAVKNKITEQYKEVIGLIRNIDKTAKSALDLAMSNSALIAENTEKISSHEFEYQTLLERLESLETENKVIKEELEDLKNRSMRKTLIFRNIQQDQRRESWDQTKIILANEIKKKMENIDHGVIIKKIERAHRAKENRHERNLPVIAKFNDWNFSEEVKTSFIKAAKDGNERTSIFVLQMYLPALTTRRNVAMKKRKELREGDQGIRAYVRYPAVLMVKAACTPYAEY